MKVLQINSVCGIGSTGKLAVSISDFLNEKQVENYIAYGYLPSDRNNTYRFGNSPDHHLHSFLSRQFCMQGYGSGLATLQLIRYIKRIKPDIVHLHNIHGHYLNFRILFHFLSKSKLNVVWTLHDCWSYTGKCAHYSDIGCSKWQIKCEDCPQLSTYPDSRRDRSRQNYLDKKAAFTTVDKLYLVTVSQWLRDEVKKSFFKDKKIQCIYNGIDTDLYRPVESDIRKRYQLEGKYVILGVSGVWNHGKGLADFFKLSELIDGDSRIVLVGITDEQKKSLPDKILGIHRTESQEELIRLYSMADVLVSCSTEETFGLVVAEAMACGTPAIVYDATACPEVVGNDSRFIVKPHNIRQLKEKIDDMRTEDEETIRQEIRMRIVESFSYRSMVAQYYDLYERINQIDESQK